jgi:hypothetical protein
MSWSARLLSAQLGSWSGEEWLQGGNPKGMFGVLSEVLRAWTRGVRRRAFVILRFFRFGESKKWAQVQAFEPQKRFLRIYGVGVHLQESVWSSLWSCTWGNCSSYSWLFKCVRVRSALANTVNCFQNYGTATTCTTWKRMILWLPILCSTDKSALAELRLCAGQLFRYPLLAHLKKKFTNFFLLSKSNLNS